MRTIGYTYNSALNCRECAYLDYSSGNLKLPGNKPQRCDVNGIPENLVDWEGNSIRPVFITDENANNQVCDGCFLPLIE